MYVVCYAALGAGAGGGSCSVKMIETNVSDGRNDNNELKQKLQQQYSFTNPNTHDSRMMTKG